MTEFGFANKMVEKMCREKYDYIDNFFGGFAGVMLNGKVGFIDTDGNEVIEIKYDNAGTIFANGFARVCINNKWGFVDTAGKEITEIKYDDAWNFENGFAIIRIDKKWGFITKNGNEVILHSVEDFENEFAKVTYTGTTNIKGIFLHFNN